MVLTDRTLDCASKNEVLKPVNCVGYIRMKLLKQIISVCTFTVQKKKKKNVWVCECVLDGDRDNMVETQSEVHNPYFCSVDTV